jgi:hypothetical protein
MAPEINMTAASSHVTVCYAPDISTKYITNAAMNEHNLRSLPAAENAELGIP